MADSADLLAWRNEFRARKMFKNQSRVSPRDHMRWLSEKLEDQETFIFIGEEVGIGKVGVCRIEKSSSSMNYEISVTIPQDLRGRGIGSEFTRLVISAFWLEISCPIVAWVNKSNLASVSLFTNLGFIASGLSQGDFLQFKLDVGCLI
jgi:L-amino acid N-acyltransferase YncA